MEDSGSIESSGPELAQAIEVSPNWLIQDTDEGVDI